MPLIASHHITVIRFSRTGVILLALLMAVGPTLYGWNVLRAGADNGCFLNHQCEYRVLSFRTVDVSDTVSTVVSQ